MKRRPMAPDPEVLARCRANIRKPGEPPTPEQEKAWLLGIRPAPGTATTEDEA